MPARGRGRGDLKTSRWKQTRKQILDRDAHECQIGGPRCTRIATEVDHVVPALHGGDDNPGNLRAACKPCNSAAGARLRGKVAPKPAQGAFLTRLPTPAPPALISLAGPRGGPMRTRTYRDLPE